MKYYRPRSYFVYILTNQSKTVLYVGVTNNLGRRIVEHKNEKNADSFTGRYKLHYLIYWEQYGCITDAIDREKQIKRWRREKKEAIIKTMNPAWEFLNYLV